jgi:hypothetical protein
MMAPPSSPALRAGAGAVGGAAARAGGDGVSAGRGAGRTGFSC